MSPLPFKENRGPVSPSRADALYLHVPFCRSKCRYCDFYSVGFDAAAAESFVRAAVAELSAAVAAGKLTTPLDSVYVGGGTPTVLGAEVLGRLFRAVAPLTGRDTEFTVEANPDSVNRAVVEVMAASAVNRVSLGVQSFQDGELRLLGRAHTARQAGRAVEALNSAGITNVSLDLIYGIPGQGLTSWTNSLGRAVGLPIEHLSCYGLSFEPGTPLGRDLAAGRVIEPPEQLQRDCYYAAIEAAESAGLVHYEISNFARPASRCRHNLAYWHNRPYLGIGPAAASYLAGVRRKNLPDLQAYTTAALNGRAPPSTAERLTGKAAMAEALMLALRLTDGVDRRAFAARYGCDPLEAFADSLSRYQRIGAVVATPARLRIDRDALFVSDSILAEIVCRQ